MNIDLSYHGSKSAEELDYICSLIVGNTWEHLERLNRPAPTDDDFPVVVLDERVGAGGLDLGRTMLLTVGFAKWIVNEYWCLDVDFDSILKIHNDEI